MLFFKSKILNSKKFIVAGFLFSVLGFLQISSQAAEEPTIIPAPNFAQPTTNNSGLQKAVFSGGCFWGVQGVFEHVRGVKKVYSGYAGGEGYTAEYEKVSSGTTGHAESVEITFDPAVVSYGDLLQIFFSVAHDPTQLNRQGPDRGTQYRSAIFYANDAQKATAQAYINQLNQAKVFSAAIVTKVDPLKNFYKAEDYHQDFLIRNPHYPYIVHNDLPKIENLQKIFPEKYQGVPVKVTDKVTDKISP